MKHLKKVILFTSAVLFIASINFTSYAAQQNIGSSQSTATAVKKQNILPKQDNLPQVSNATVKPSVTLIKPSNDDVWQKGKSYDIVWESKLLTPGSTGTVTLTVFISQQSNCQPVNNLPLNGTISYNVPSATANWTGTDGFPHGKAGAMLNIKFVDKATGKDYYDQRKIYILYP